MFKRLPKEQMHVSDIGWLKSRFHFSFADYINRDNLNFGVLRVLNDDIIYPKSGFPTHPHQNMEIVSYIVEGEITHKDSMGNEETLKPGEVQYLSAGAGITHSEYNIHESMDLRLLQIWIIPPAKNLERLYGSHRYTTKQRHNTLLPIVSSEAGDAKIKLHQDVNFYVSELDSGKALSYDIRENRQIYYVQISGEAMVSGIMLYHGDAMEITDERLLQIEAKKDSHFLFIEMAS